MRDQRGTRRDWGAFGGGGGDYKAVQVHATSSEDTRVRAFLYGLQATRALLRMKLLAEMYARLSKLKNSTMENTQLKEQFSLRIVGSSGIH